MTNTCQQLFALFNINLTIFFQIDLSIGQNDEYFCVKTTSHLFEIDKFFVIYDKFVRLNSPFPAVFQTEKDASLR